MSTRHPHSPRAVMGFVLGLLLLGTSSVRSAQAEDDPAAATDPKAQAAALIVALKSKDPDARIEALERTATNQHDSLTAPLVHLLSDRDLGVRYAAMTALGARKEARARRKAARALVPRLARLRKHPADRAELLRVIDALRLLQQPAAIKPLLGDIDVDMELDEVEARINAVAGVPHADAIDRLIQFLAKGGRRGGGVRKKHRTAASKGLQYATGQKLGSNPDKWRAWWRENKKDFSFEALAEQREDASAERRKRAEGRKNRKKGGAGQKRGGKRRDGKQGGKRKPDGDA